MLGLICSPTRFSRRTAHGKGAWANPEHFHLNAGIEISSVRACHANGNCSGGVHFVTGIIGHRVG